MDFIFYVFLSLSLMGIALKRETKLLREQTIQNIVDCVDLHIIIFFFHMYIWILLTILFKRRSWDPKEAGLLKSLQQGCLVLSEFG